jgi:hypothetical protein
MESFADRHPVEEQICSSDLGGRSLRRVERLLAGDDGAASAGSTSSIRCRYASTTSVGVSFSRMSCASSAQTASRWLGP